MPELDIDAPLGPQPAASLASPVSTPTTAVAHEVSQAAQASGAIAAGAAFASAAAAGAALSNAAFENPLYAGFALPLPGAEPCGPNLEYDLDFHALQAAAAGKPERQYGATIIAAEPPDWPAVHQQALALAARTRDLRVVVWLIRSAARGPGLIEVAHGLQLLRTLLEHHWAPVHPVLELDEATATATDATARLSALGALSQTAGLADLRAAPLTPQRGSITVRELELAFGRAEPLSGEPVPTEAGAVLAVAAAQAQFPALAEAMARGLQAVRAITQVLQAQLGVGLAASAAPLDLTPLDKLLACVAQAGLRAAPGVGAAVGAGVSSGVGVGAAALNPNPPAASLAHADSAHASGAIKSRDDAIRALERVCAWIELNEPTNPAPLLIQRAQRLMQKNFIEIIRDLLPEGLGQIEKLAGPGRE